MDPVLQAHDLRKSYGTRAALRGLSFSLEAGRILGFLGPNGAGKTTAIRILTTILEPTSGHFVVDGVRSDQPGRIRQRIGVLPESLGFPKQITAIEYLTHFGRLYGRGPSEARARGLTLLQQVALERRANTLIGTFSRGMRQRLGIARALINDPVVVFLDEPTLGLDPRGQQELLALIERIARERRAGVILCSHFLSEIEEVCDDVVILNSGQVVATGSVGDVIQRARQTGIQGNLFRIRVPAPSVGQAKQLLETASGVGRVTPGADSGGWLGIELLDGQGDPALLQRARNGVLDTLIRADIPIVGLEAEGGRLRDVFLQLTQEAGE